MFRLLDHRPSSWPTSTCAPRPRGGGRHEGQRLLLSRRLVVASSSSRRRCCSARGGDVLGRRFDDSRTGAARELESEPPDGPRLYSTWRSAAFRPPLSVLSRHASTCRRRCSRIGWCDALSRPLRRPQPFSAWTRPGSRRPLAIALGKLNTRRPCVDRSGLPDEFEAAMSVPSLTMRERRD